MTTWAGQTPCSPKALFVYALVHRPGQHVYPTMPKLTLPGASFSSSISQQEPKTHSCSPVSACLSSPLCRGRTTREGVARMALIHEWQRGQNERGIKKKIRQEQLARYPWKRRCVLLLFLLHGQNSKIKPAVGNYFASTYSISTEHWPKPLGADRWVAIDLLSYWSVCLIWPVGLSSYHCYSRKLPLWDLFLKMRSGQRAGTVHTTLPPVWCWGRPSTLHPRNSSRETTAAARAISSSFPQTHYSMTCGTCLLVTDEILSADAGVVLWGAR